MATMAEPRRLVASSDSYDATKGCNQSKSWLARKTFRQCLLTMMTRDDDDKPQHVRRSHQISLQPVAVPHHSQQQLQYRSASAVSFASGAAREARHGKLRSGKHGVGKLVKDPEAQCALARHARIR